jgi:hypothetical protein
MSITNDGRLITPHQLREAVAGAIHYSNAQDQRMRSSRSLTPTERSAGRLSAFSTALALGLDTLAPGVFDQMADFEEDVALGRNPLRADPAKEQGK